MTFSENFKLDSPTGAAIRVLHAPAQGPERGVLQVNHGLAEHAARYDRFARFMAHRGFGVYAHDHRGHGATTAPDAPRGVFAAGNGAAKVIADCLAIHDMIADRHPGLPVIAFGHSMGGQICLNFVARHPERVSGAAIWNASFSAGLMGRVARGLLAWERFRLGSDVQSRILPKLTFDAWGRSLEGARTPFDWLSRDTAEVDKYVSDPDCGWNASISMWNDVLDFVSFGADDANLARLPRAMPFSLVGGENDPATGGGKAVAALARRMAKMGFSDISTRVYAETRHESLNELNRDAVMEDFARWADHVLHRHAIKA